MLMVGLWARAATARTADHAGGRSGVLIAGRSPGEPDGQERGVR